MNLMVVLHFYHFFSIEILSDLGSSDKDYEPDTDEEDDDDTDMVLDIDEMRNVLTDASSSFYTILTLVHQRMLVRRCQ